MTTSTNRTRRIVALLMSMLITSACASPVSGPHDPYAMGTVQAAYDATPAPVWDVLRQHGYVGTGADNCECLYIAVNTVVSADGAMWTMTPSGWVAGVSLS
jgi:hypothetical protein